MEIVIRSYLSGSFLLQSEPNVWDAIVILDPRLAEPRFVVEQARSQLFLRFDDIESASGNKRLATADDLKMALEFASNSQQLLVCCRAGQSRSAAIAFAASFQQLGPEAAFELLNPRRHVPNQLVVELADQVINDAGFLSTFHDWEQAHRGIRMTDYLDEIVEEMDSLVDQGAIDRISRTP